MDLAEFKEVLRTFLLDPLVYPIYLLTALSLANFALAVYRAIRQGLFDWRRLDRVVDTLVLRKVIPLTALAFAAWAASGSPAGTALSMAFGGLSATAIMAEVNNLKGIQIPDVPMDEPNG